MTADGLASELPTGAVLALCDKVLGEVGRRSHRFAWLRAPGAVADAWLPVEAYYPRHRLVVVCHSERAPYDHLFGQLVPQHGLRLLKFAPRELGTDLTAAEQALRRMIARLPDAAAPEQDALGARARAPRERATTLASVAGLAARRPATARPAPEPALAAQAPPRRAGGLPRRSSPLPVDAPEPVRAMRESLLGSARGRSSLRAAGTAEHSPEIVAVGVAAGLALAAICGAELILAVIAVALDSGRVVLGLGLAFDACARVLGALDSGRVGKTGWAWAAAIIGSPAVVAAAILEPRPRRPRRVTGPPPAPGEGPIEAAPLAALIASLALVFVLIGLVS